MLQFVLRAVLWSDVICTRLERKCPCSLEDGQNCGNLDALQRMMCKNQLPHTAAIFTMRNVNMGPWRRYLSSVLPHGMQPRASKLLIQGRR